MNAEYDFIFSKILYRSSIQDILSSRGIICECFNPIVHNHANEFDTKEYICVFTTTGNLHPYRIQFFKNLLDLDLDIRFGDFLPKVV